MSRTGQSVETESGLVEGWGRRVGLTERGSAGTVDAVVHGQQMPRGMWGPSLFSRLSFHFPCQGKVPPTSTTHTQGCRFRQLVPRRLAEGRPGAGQPLLRSEVRSSKLQGPGGLGRGGGDEPSACPGVRAGALPGPQASQCQGANSPVCRPGRAPLVCMEPCEGGSQKARLGPPRGPQENRDPWGLQHPCPPWQCPPGLPTSPSWSVPGA